MNSNRMTRIASVAASIAAAALVFGSVPASASNDPETQAPAPTAKPDARKPLSRAARKAVWCVAQKDTGEKVCKSRESWIREGKDPFGQY